MRRRRRASATAGSVVLVVLASIAVWSSRAHAPSTAPAVTDVGTPTTQAEPSTTEAVASTTTTVASTSPGASSYASIPADPRGAATSPAAVWTGSEVLVAGGVDPNGGFRAGASAYDPATRAWRSLADPPSDQPRLDPIVAWTGSEMLTLGGTGLDGTELLSDGLAYDPAADSWRSIGPLPGFMRGGSPAAWTGSELLVWASDQAGNVGAAPVAFDPAADSWRQLPASPIEPRRDAASVWTGEEWIIWGGHGAEGELADGAAFNPTTSTWRVIAASPLSARRVRAVWTGSEMIVAAGATGGNADGNGAMAQSDGAAYDPVSDSWRKIADGFAHPGFLPVWTGQQMILFAKAGAVVYDVASDQWIDMCCSVDQGGVVGGTPVWTGTVVVLAGSHESTIGGAIFTPPSSLAGAVRPCEGGPDPDLDVRNEPPWRQYGDYREWSRHGCLVRIDVLADRPAPDHCGWQSARVIITGSPLGARYSDPTNDVEYIRDPENVLGFAAQLDVDAQLPANAVDTGYRSGTTALWLRPNDDSSIYLVDGDKVERWPKGESPLCA